MSDNSMKNRHPILSAGVATAEGFRHVREMFGGDVASQAIGLRITALDKGRCEGEFTVREDMCNGHGTCQGGFLFTFADSLFAGACNSHGEIAVAAQVNIHFIAPVLKGQKVRGVAVEKQRYGRNGITDVTLYCGDKVVAEFRGTSRVVPGVPQ